MFVIACFVFALFTALYWPLTLTLDESADNAIKLETYMIVLAIWSLFQLVYHPIYLRSHPKRLPRAYEKRRAAAGEPSVDWDAVDADATPYSFESTMGNVVNNLFDIKKPYLAYYSLFRFDETRATEVFKQDLEIFYKGRVKFDASVAWAPHHGPYEWRLVSSDKRFWYLFSTGFWFLGTLKAVCAIFGANNRFHRKIDVAGSVYVAVFVALNAAIVLILVTLNQIAPINQSQTLQNVSYASPLIILVIDAAYAHLVGGALGKAALGWAKACANGV